MSDQTFLYIFVVVITLTGIVWSIAVLTGKIGIPQ